MSPNGFKGLDESFRKPYPSDVSEEERSLIAPYLTVQREGAGQREHSLCEVFNGLRNIVKTRRYSALSMSTLPVSFATVEQHHHLGHDLRTDP